MERYLDNSTRIGPDSHVDDAMNREDRISPNPDRSVKSQQKHTTSHYCPFAGLRI